MRHAFEAALLVCCALIATPVTAQVLSSPPPSNYSLDERGVDLVTGIFAYQSVDVVIGDPNQGGLTYARTYLQGGWRDNVTGTVVQSGTTVTVSVGGLSEVFTQSGTTYAPQTPTGATLIKPIDINFIYTSADETEYRFYRPLDDQPYSPAGGYQVFRLTDQVRPNGEHTSYIYDEAYAGPYHQPSDPHWIRLVQVENSYGYRLLFDYELNDPTSPNDEAGYFNLLKVTGVNTAVDPCVGPTPTCTLTRAWPSASYRYLYNPHREEVTDQSGRTTILRSPGGSIHGVTYPGDSLESLTVTYGVGGVASVAGASGTWTYTHSTSGTARTTTATGPLGQSLTAVSNLSIDRVTSLKDSLNHTVQYAYDAQRRLTQQTRPEGDATTWTYDARGNVIQTYEAPKPGSGLTGITTTAVFPAACASPASCNRPTSTMDARGTVTNYAYDPVHGGLTSIAAPAPATGAAQPQTRIAYAAQTGGLVLPVAISSCATGSAPSCIGTASEARTVLTYGSSGVGVGLLTAVTRRDGIGAVSATTALTYTPDGDLASVNGPLSGTADTTSYRYDDARQLVCVIGPDPDGGGALLRRALRYTYDQRGAVTLAEQGTVMGLTDPNWDAFNSLQQTAATYDLYGRVQLQRLQAGGTTFSLAQTGYDAAGRVECVALRMNTAGFASPPASACALGTAGAFGPDRIVRYAYDSVGRMNASTSGYGSGSPITEGATYTANGLPLTLTDGKGNVSTLVYDGFDRLSRLRYPNTSGGGSSTTDYEEYGYDAGSNLITQRNRAGVVFTATYDKLNRNTALSASASFTPVAYTYDNFDRLLTASIPTQTTTMAWDALDRMISETGPLGTMAYQYDPAGRRTRQTWPDGFFVTNSWNLADEMAAISHGSTTQIVGFGYDNLGRRTGVTRGNGVSTSYGYDGASRLTGLTHDIAGTAADVTFGYTYNPAGQIATKTTSNPSYVWTSLADTTGYGIDGLNLVISVNGAATTYDLNRQMTGDTVRTFNYDAAGRLLGVNGGTSTLNYDALGRVFDYVGSNGGTHIYDGDEVAGFAPAGTTTLQNRFIRGPGVDEVVANYTSAATGATPTYYWLLDERNSTLSGTEGATGVHAYINTYDEYGLPAASNQGRFQYAGQRWMPDFGLYDYKARVYNPTLGRFMQPDPIGYEAGANLYAYVGDDPVNWVDPAGLMQSMVGGRTYTVCVVERTAKGSDLKTCRTYTIPGFPSGFSGGGAGGMGGAFPGGGSNFDRPPITADPQYARFQAAYQDAAKRNEIYAEPVLLFVPAGPAIRLGRGAGVVSRAASRVLGNCNCFVAGTEVQTVEGLKPIEQIAVGDRVLARDDATGETALRPVVALIAGGEREIWEVTVETTDAQGRVQREPIGTTDEHPWRTAGGAWLETRDLMPGMELVSADGDRAVVAAVVRTDRIERTYNFEVEGFHTYFVGESGVWVHNACTTFLYQKLGAAGQHLKFGITRNPATRYTVAQLNGGRLKLLAEGTRSEMLALERQLHSTLPIGPQEGQLFYLAIQAARGLRTPPY